MFLLAQHHLYVSHAVYPRVREKQRAELKSTKIIVTTITQALKVSSGTSSWAPALLVADRPIARVIDEFQTTPVLEAAALTPGCK